MTGVGRIERPAQKTDNLPRSGDGKAAAHRAINTLPTLARKGALQGDRADLAEQAAEAVATLENEATVRRDTLRALNTRIIRLRDSIEAGHRRLIDLRQGALAARALRREQQSQRQMRSVIGKNVAIDEAEELIARVLNRDDPSEQADILREIDSGLDRRDLPDRMAEAGFGPSPRTTAADILARLNNTPKN